MSDVAALAGVATMTVSRVLNGYASVSDKTRRLVQRAARELKYQPDHLASALRGSRSHTIGVLLPSMFDSRCSALLQGINETAWSSRHSVILGITGDRPGTEQEQTLAMVRRRVDGLIVMAGRGGTKRAALDVNGMSVVYIDRLPSVSSLDSVAVEHRQGSYLAARHLQQHGHKRIVFLGSSPRLHIIQERLAGYKQAMEEAGLWIEAHLACSSVESVARALAVDRAPPTGPTAVVAGELTVVRYLFQALKRLGIAAPDEVAVIGCDDFEMAEVLQSPLTVVSQPVYRMGQEAARLLISRLEGKRDEPFTHIMLPCELVLRGSCGCTSADLSSTPGDDSMLVVGADAFDLQ